VATLLAASVLPFMQATVLAPALFAIRESFWEHQSAAFMTRLVLVAPTIAIVLSASAVGFLIDRAYKQHVLAAALLLYAACGIACYLSATLEQIVVARFVLGFSLAAIATTTTALIGDYFAGPTREAMFGWQNALRGAANTAFPIVGAAIALADWRLIFLINLAALLLLWPTLALPSAAPVQTTSRQPFSYADALLIYGLSFLGLLVLYLLTLQIAFHLSEIGMRSPVWPGAALAIAALCAALTSTRYGHLRRHLSFMQIAGFAFALMAVGYGSIAVFTAPAGIVAGLAVAGLGFGMNTPNCSACLLDKAPAGARGKALGGLTTAMFLGQLASPFVYEPMLGVLGSSATFLAMSIVAFLVALSLAGQRRSSRPTPSA
jgi:MFS family permease